MEIDIENAIANDQTGSLNIRIKEILRRAFNIVEKRLIKNGVFVSNKA